MSSDLAATFSYRRRHRCCPSSLFELLRQFLLLASGCVAICHGQQPLGGAHGNRREGPPPTNCAEYWQFPCEDGQHCIARYDQCDGIEQCPDASDEKHCQPNERPPNELGRFDTQKQQQQQHERSSTEAEHQQKQTTIATNASGGTSAHEKRVPLELLLMGAAAFVLVAALVHAVMKATRRRRLAARGSAGASARRGFRKGESLVEDEDDLLISQMYG